MRKEKTIKRGTLYRLYIVDGVFFVEDYTKPADRPAPGFDTMQGVQEYIYYNDLEV